MPIIFVTSGAGFENYYLNVSDDHFHNEDKNNAENSFISFFVALILMCLLIQLVRCCVYLSKTYNKKHQYRILDNLNVNREGVNNECPICLETISDKFVLECNHAFNKKCFYQWVETSIQNNSFKCPLCNVDYEIN